MKNFPIKIKICEDVEDFAIAPDTLNMVSNGSWCYMQRFEITIGEYTLHRFITEAGDNQARGTSIVIGEGLANELGVTDRQKITIDLSRREPTSRIQIETRKKDSNTASLPLPYVAGIMPVVGKCIRYEGENYAVKSCNPIGGYIDEDTIVEIIGEDGEVDLQESNLIRGKSSLNGTGMDDVTEEILSENIGPVCIPTMALPEFSKIVAEVIEDLIEHRLTESSNHAEAIGRGS